MRFIGILIALCTALVGSACAQEQAPRVANSTLEDQGLSISFPGWSPVAVQAGNGVPVILEIHADNGQATNVFRACQLRRHAVLAPGASQEAMNARVTPSMAAQAASSWGQVLDSKVVMVDGVAVADFQTTAPDHGVSRMRQRVFFFVHNGATDYYAFSCTAMAAENPDLRANTDSVIESLHFSH